MARALDGQVAIVTGAGRGIGRAITRALATEGANVVLAARTRADLASAVDDVRAAGSEALAMPTDVREERDVAALVDEAVGRFDRVDILVNAAGTASFGPVADTKTDDWDRVFAVNLRGAMLTLQAAMPVLAEGSSIVMISSIASMKPGSRLPSYDASKAAMDGLMRHVGLEGERRGIRINIVAPGLMDTSIGREATRGRPNRAKTPVPLGRQGTGWETAYATLFLMSDEAAYITGQVLAVDGGMTGLR